MSSPLKLGVYLILGALALVLVVNLAKTLIALVLPLAMVAGIGLILYSFINKRALGSSRRYLP
jgi:hypothetical protein